MTNGTLSAVILGWICLICCTESTNQRVFWYSLLSTSVIILNAAWQIMYLKRDFKKKKLI
jgi:hypothetical protein